MAILSCYTRTDRQTIETAWSALMRAVESNSLQERRLSAVLREDAKSFGRIAAKSHIIGMVRHAMVADDRQLLEVAHQRDGRVMCAMVGVYLRDTLSPGQLVATFLAAEEVELAAQQRFLATLHNPEGN